MDDAHVKAFRQLHDHLIARARMVARRARNYRQFLVGCVVLAWSDDWDGEGLPYRLFVGANMMPIKDGPKICAELVAVGAARAAGAKKIIAIAVAGDPQKDDQSGVDAPTLHPCWICRTMLRHLPEVEDDTIILTVCNGAGPVEQHTFAQILALHNGGGHAK